MIKNHPLEKIIGRKDKGVMTRNRVNEELCLISQVESKSIDETCEDDHQIQEIKEELDQIVKNKTWDQFLDPQTIILQEPNGYSKTR